mgnify:CR=1 FL=1
MVRYEYFRDQKLIVCTLAGEVSLEEVIGLVLKINEDSDIDPGIDVVTDVTGLKTPLTLEDMRYMAQRSAEGLLRGKKGDKMAIVASDDLNFGLSRMYEIDTSIRKNPYTVRVFRSWEEAMAWLDRAPPPEK